MQNYYQEQFMVILTTILALLTAWAWNDVLKQYLHDYYGNGITVRTIFAIVMTVASLLLLNWVLRHIIRKPHPEMDDK